MIPKHSPDSVSFVNISCGPFLLQCFCPQWGIYISAHSSPHTYLFLYSGWLDPSSWIGLSCFSSSQQRHVLGVVASQSVAACGFPRVFFFFHLSPSLYLSAFYFSVTPDLCPALSVSFFASFASFFALSCSSLFLSKLCSNWGIVLYASWLLPSLSPILTVACCSIPLSMSAAEHGRPRLLHYIRMCACCCSAYIMWSLRTFSQLTVNELVRLHKRGCRTGFELVPPQSNWLQKWYQNVVCVLKSHFKTQTEALVVPWGAFYHLYTYSPSALSTGSKPAQRLTKQAICTRSPWVLSKEPCCQGMHLQRAFPIVLAADCTNALPVTYESHKDSCGYIHTDCCTTEGDCIVLPSDALEKPHCDDCYSLLVSLFTLADWIMCMFSTVHAWCGI